MLNMGLPGCLIPLLVLIQRSDADDANETASVRRLRGYHRSDTATFFELRSLPLAPLAYCWHLWHNRAFSDGMAAIDADLYAFELWNEVRCLLTSIARCASLCVSLLQVLDLSDKHDYTRAYMDEYKFYQNLIENAMHLYGDDEHEYAAKHGYGDIDDDQFMMDADGGVAIDGAFHYRRSRQSLLGPNDPTDDELDKMEKGGEAGADVCDTDLQKAIWKLLIETLKKAKETGKAAAKGSLVETINTMFQQVLAGTAGAVVGEAGLATVAIDIVTHVNAVQNGGCSAGGPSTVDAAGAPQPGTLWSMGRDSLRAILNGQGIPLELGTLASGTMGHLSTWQTANGATVVGASIGNNQMLFAITRSASDQTLAFLVQQTALLVLGITNPVAVAAIGGMTAAMTPDQAQVMAHTTFVQIGSAAHTAANRAVQRLSGADSSGTGAASSGWNGGPLPPPPPPGPGDVRRRLATVPMPALPQVCGCDIRKKDEPKEKDKADKFRVDEADAVKEVGKKVMEKVGKTILKLLTKLKAKIKLIKKGLTPAIIAATSASGLANAAVCVFGNEQIESVLLTMFRTRFRFPRYRRQRT